jgi:hypothetical protein
MEANILPILWCSPRGGSKRGPPLPIKFEGSFGEILSIFPSFDV